MKLSQSLKIRDLASSNYNYSRLKMIIDKVNIYRIRSI